jgi:hypothetical protein
MNAKCRDIFPLIGAFTEKSVMDADKKLSLMLGPVLVVVILTADVGDCCWLGMHNAVIIFIAMRQREVRLESYTVGHSML